MRHFLTLADFDARELLQMLALALELKLDLKSGRLCKALEGKILGMIFEKNSTRTRVSFEAGIYQLGGMGIFLSSRDIQLSRGESISDSAKVISSMLDMIMIRTFEHSRLEEFAKYSRVPVINGLSDSYHPTQAMADYLTMMENGIFHPRDCQYLQKILEKCKITHRCEPQIAYVGDGNNMANSYMMLAAVLGLKIKIASPRGYEPDKKITQIAQDLAGRNGGRIEIFTSAPEAVAGANVVITDTWVSMGQEEEKQERKRIFQAYSVDAELMKLAHKESIFLHCLPAYRGEEVSAEVIDGERSRVFQEAENRLHAQKGIMLWLSQNQ